MTRWARDDVAGFWMRSLSHELRSALKNVMTAELKPFICQRASITLASQGKYGDLSWGKLSLSLLFQYVHIVILHLFFYLIDQIESFGINIVLGPNQRCTKASDNNWNFLWLNAEVNLITWLKATSIASISRLGLGPLFSLGTWPHAPPHETGWET